MSSFKDQTGADVLPTVDAEGSVPVTGKFLAELMETNRLLRKLIQGLEVHYGETFLEVE